jgi:hypothetical protein
MLEAAFAQAVQAAQARRRTLVKRNSVLPP